MLSAERKNRGYSRTHRKPTKTLLARPARWPGMILAVLGGGGLLSIAVLSGPSAMAQTAVTTGSGQAARIAAPAAPAGDSPTGFWYGTDSTAMNVPGPAPYREPAIGGAYGGRSEERRV